MPSSSASARKLPKTSIAFVSNGSKGGSSNLFWSVRTATPTHCAEPLEGCTQVSQVPWTSSSKNNCNSPARLGPSTTTTASAASSSSTPERWSLRSRTVAPLWWAGSSSSGLKAGGSSSSPETKRSFIHSMFHNKKLSSVTFILLTVVLSRRVRVLTAPWYLRTGKPATCKQVTMNSR